MVQKVNEVQHLVVIGDPNSPHEGCLILARVDIKGTLADTSGPAASTQHLVVLGLTGHLTANEHIGIHSKLGVESSIFFRLEEQDASFAVD